MILVTLAVTLVMAMAILSDWRRALPWLFGIGVLQDVLRKLTPNVPATYILWIGAMFALVALMAYSQGALRGRWRALALGDAGLRQAWSLFALVVVAQAAHAVLRWGNPLIGALGIAFYLGPVLALMVGMAYARSLDQIDRLLGTYVLIMVPAVLTVYLSADYGAQWPVLREVGFLTGQQLLIHYGGQVLESLPGVFRVGELAAWHAATSIAFLSILVLRRPSLVRVIGAGLLGALLIGAILLTGRRKMLMALTLFFSFQWVLIILLRQGATRLSGALLALALTLAVGFSFLGHEEADIQRATYVDRGLTVFESTGERWETTMNLVQSAWYRSRGLGVGAGVAGQGGRYAGGGGAEAVGGAAEAGLGFIIVELGLPGVLAMVWLMFLLVRRLWQGLRLLAWVNPPLLVYAVSFAALLMANLATFGVAVQLFSDYAVLITLGLTAGMLFALIDAGIQDYGSRLAAWHAGGWLRAGRSDVRADAVANAVAVAVANANADDA